MLCICHPKSFFWQSLKEQCYPTSNAVLLPNPPDHHAGMVVYDTIDAFVDSKAFFPFLNSVCKLLDSYVIASLCAYICIIHFFLGPLSHSSKTLPCWHFMLTTQGSPSLCRR